MTIVAYSKGIMASDSKISDNTCDGDWAFVKKIRRVNGWLIGAAGDWDMLTHYLAKFNPECIEKGLAYAPINPAPSKGDFEALAVSPKGKVYYVEDSGVFGAIKTKGFIAIGSGTTVAMVAMELGKSSIEAVKLACKYRGSCGGRIYSLKL